MESFKCFKCGHGEKWRKSAGQNKKQMGWIGQRKWIRHRNTHKPRRIITRTVIEGNAEERKGESKTDVVLDDDRWMWNTLKKRSDSQRNGDVGCFNLPKRAIHLWSPHRGGGVKLRGTYSATHKIRAHIIHPIFISCKEIGSFVQEFHLWMD